MRGPSAQALAHRRDQIASILQGFSEWRPATRSPARRRLAGGL